HCVCRDCGSVRNDGEVLRLFSVGSRSHGFLEQTTLVSTGTGKEAVKARRRYRAHLAISHPTRVRALALLISSLSTVSAQATEKGKSVRVPNNLTTASNLSDGIVAVKDYGAKGDGIVDDRTALTIANETVGPNGSLYFPR